MSDNLLYIQELLGQVNDPEVPVLSILDLGIVRQVIIQDNVYQIKISPTYSGCPAMDTIQDDISSILKENGIENFEIQQVLSPPWTTDWMTENGKKKLEEYGIAPPVGSASKLSIFGNDDIIPCPKCKSKNTKLISQFGSTACKALYQCEDCLEPFDYFKCI